MYYVAIMEGAGDVWSLRIPDLPGCHGGGGSEAEAIADAISAAREWVGHQSGRGIAVSAARPMAEVIGDAAVEFDPAREWCVAIPVILDQGRSVRANISLDAGLLEVVDAEARRRGITRSAFMASAARDKIEDMA